MRSPLCLLQTNETQLPQPFFIMEVLYSFYHLRCPTLDPLQQFPVLLELRGPELDTIFQMWSHQGGVEGKEDLSRSTSHLPSNTPQDAICLPGHKGTVLVHGHPVVHQDPQVPFPYTALQQVLPQLTL